MTGQSITAKSQLKMIKRRSKIIKSGQQKEFVQKLVELRPFFVHSLANNVHDTTGRAPCDDPCAGASGCLATWILLPTGDTFMAHIMKPFFAIYMIDHRFFCYEHEMHKNQPNKPVENGWVDLENGTTQYHWFGPRKGFKGRLQHVYRLLAMPLFSR